MKLSEADKALVAAKLQGGDRIVFFTDEVNAQVEEARQKGSKTEEQKIADEYLNKGAPAMNPGPNAGFSGAHKPAAPSVDAPAGGQGDHEEGKSIHDLLAEDAAPAPEQTHAAKDFEKQLHDEAWKGEEEDIHADGQKNTNIEQIKGQVVQALQALKQQAPVLEQMKAQAPQAYQAMMGLAQSVIALARELAPAQPEQPQALGKAEDITKADKSVELVHYSVKPGLKRIDTKHMGTGAPSSEYKQGLPEVPRAYYYRAGSTPEPLVTQGAKGVYGATLGPQHRLYDIGKDPEGLRAPAHERFLAGEGLNSPEDTFLADVKARGYHGYHNSASAMPHVVALFHGHPVRPLGKDEESMEKAKLPMPSAKPHHEVNLPTGSVVDQKLKVTHNDGTSSWKQMDAGQIRSQDPAGHATSSRSPNSR
jgi:hypothetical protein